MSVIDNTKVISYLKISRNEICSKSNIFIKKYKISQTIKKVLLLRTDVPDVYDIYHKPFTSLK
jgi:hypothetical protein